MVYSFFWKMPTHSSQIGLVLQNVFFWGGELFTDGLLCRTTLQNCFVFSEKWKTPDFFQGILLNGFICFFGIWPEVGVAFTKWFWFFSKNNEYPYKMVCSFFWENVNSLIQKWLSLTEWFIKFLEIWRYLKLFLQNGL